MIRYFEIKQGTKEHADAEKVFAWKKDWQKDEVLKEIQDAIGIDPIKNMEMDPWVLRLVNIPGGSRCQFKKNLIDGKYEALAKSDINKRYLAIVEKYNLKVFTMQSFSFQFGWGYIHSLCPIINGEDHRFFLQMRDELSDESLKKFATHPSLVEFKEYDYLILRADMLKNLEGEQK